MAEQTCEQWIDRIDEHVDHADDLRDRLTILNNAGMGPRLGPAEAVLDALLRDTAAFHDSLIVLKGKQG
jgi:hypothetical protein